MRKYKRRRVGKFFGRRDKNRPDNVSISSEIADLLIEWIQESPDRVWLIGMDTDDTNIAPLQNKYIADAGTFVFNNTANVTPATPGLL